MSVAESIEVEAPIVQTLRELEEGNYSHAGALLKIGEVASLDVDQVARLLRLLIEGGYYELAENTGRRIGKVHKNRTVSATGKMFGLFANFFTTGGFDEAVAGIEAVLDGKDARSHATLRARALDLLGRTVALGVSFRIVPEDMILRARSLIADASKGFERGGLYYEQIRALQALAQMHCSGSHPDIVSAISVLQTAYAVAVKRNLVQLQAEVVRRTKELECLAGEGADISEIRTLFTEMKLNSSKSILDAGFYDMSLGRILRGRGLRSQDELEDASKIFSAQGYLSGLYEVTSNLGTVSLEQGHYARALRKFRELVELSTRMGFSQGIAVAQLGTFQVHVAMGEMDQATIVAQSLLKLSKSPAIAGSLGLSMAAAFQLLGDLGKALEVSRESAVLFARQRLHDMESQALFVEGSCLAGMNRWNEALRVWRRAARVDEKLGNYSAQADKLVACAQAEVMHDLVENNKVSDLALTRALRLLSSVAKTLSAKGISDPRLTAKIYQTQAQLFVVARDVMKALKAYSAARDELVKAGSSRDVAFVDAQVGLALLDIGRSKYPHMLEEALDSFRRSLEYCNGEQLITLRWKVQYYLAFGCFLVSGTKASELEASKWQEAAREWLKAARSDVATLQEHGATKAPVDGEFCPSLSFDVLDTLQKELSPRTPSSKRSSQGLVLDMKPKGKGGQWH